MGSDTYGELEAESVRVGWPKSHKTDMTEHDKHRLQGTDAPKVFGWVLRELGTLLLDPRMAKTSLAGYTRRLARAGCDGHRYYWYDGRSLVEVGRERMLKRLHELHDPSGEHPHSIY